MDQSTITLAERITSLTRVSLEQVGNLTESAVLSALSYTHLSGGRKFSATMVANMTGVPRTTVLRKLASLEVRGLLAKTECDGQPAYLPTEAGLSRLQTICKRTGLNQTN